ncbi:hypothetical protein BCV69DRAFT_313858 [Microstroma glucosiphilum]|uniref:Uncharacterized protein n=1 Tax=Pseudomicrostroma glucosiphilum TaxID=1684307 RepID=A0A316U1C5_9BASI|nr:hypothetical protein BCV69DRAFT_313858 [Pseudomicrostroma glucosiphilum]PWN19097.1 hypothetical protein BCV69DRAFT_313858 [Pseudomicrostroma glucosiphilum]
MSGRTKDSLDGLEANSDGSTAGFQIYDDAFRKLIGPSPTLRHLLTSSDGHPIFHEAGVYLRESNTVYVSSNRIPSKHARQRATITSIPLDAVPSPRGSGVLASLELTDEGVQQSLARQVRTIHDLPEGLAMPNGGTNWTHEGQEAVLWCEQGRDDLDGEGARPVSSSLVVTLPNAAAPGLKTAGVLVDNYDGKPFSSLNDVVVHQQSGVVFFTDPDYGVGQSFKSGEQVYAPNALYAWDPSTSRVTMIDDNYDKPNGVTFIPDPSDPTSGRGLLATTDTGRFFMEPNEAMGEFKVDESRPACIYTYPIEPLSRDPGSEGVALPLAIGERSLLAHSESPIPDGLHPDRQGNLWVGSGDGLHVYDPVRRTLIGKVIVPGGRGVANFCWAGKVTVHDADGESHQEGQERVRDSREMYRLLLFCEQELWEACVMVDGSD